MLRNKRLIAFIATFLIVLVSFSACSKSDNKIDINSFEKDGKYMYGDVEWNSTVDEVKEKLPYDIEFNDAMIPETADYKVYTSVEPQELDGKYAAVFFYFEDDKLESIQINFQLDGDYEEWFNSQADAMIKRYGSDYEKLERPKKLGEINGVQYDWENENTGLQLGLLEGGKIRSSAAINMGIK